MSKKILGLDLGSNSVGWAVLEEKNGQANKIIDIGSRIFNKAVEEKIPTPKNQKRRDMRLGRRVIQRRARRKQKMLHYLVSLDLLPKELKDNHQPEILLNGIGNPYELRAKGLDEKLSPHEFGRVLLHFVARRGFLSNKKQIAGDLIDDPDTIEYLAELEEAEKQKRAEKGQKAEKTKADDQSENAHKTDIAEVYEEIKVSGARTLGEYLFKLEKGKVKRNRIHDGGHLRTDRAMYQDELSLIWQDQQQYFDLPDNFIDEIEKIIFYQRPLKLKKDRVGKCSLEPKNYRANMARLEVQKFRYLQDINNLKYFERHTEQWLDLTEDKKDKLKTYFEHNTKITVTNLKKELGLDKPTKINLETKNLKGNITACKIRAVIKKQWDEMEDDKQKSLFEDLFTIKEKSALKKRLISHWNFDTQTAVKLCLLEFEPSHSNHSLKAINKLLPFLEQGAIYSKSDNETGEIGALQAAGYEDEKQENMVLEKLPAPPETANPIVNKGLHELRRVVNAIIKQHGKPDIIRIEMARDLEMNTDRVKNFIAQQKENEKANQEAQAAFEKLNLGRQYASRDQKIKYRLWKDQKECCAYSNQNIPLAQVFTASTETDHILPFAKSLDDSYMNKVICLTAENRDKGDRAPIDAWGGDNEKWNQITQAISRWDKSLQSKINRFYQQESDASWNDKDFAGSQLTDTRYISKLAQDYVRQLGCDVNVTKGFVVSQIRHQWGFNTLIGETNKKERTDHRHHAIDAVVIASTSRSLYTAAVKQIEHNQLNIALPYPDIRNKLDEKLEKIIVSHAPQRKLSGGLHEETGAGYIEKHGGLVYRKILNQEFTIKNAMSIVDDTIKKCVLAHLDKHDNIPKKAFAEGITVYHKDGKTPIKRVRVLQSKTNEKKLAQTKFGVKDKSGKVFKYLSYGNTHHVEIIKNNKTGKIKGEFVTMMEASHRAKGIKMSKQPIIKTNHGENWEFVMVLHINDTVSVKNGQGERIYYRVQQLDSGANRIMLRLATAATLDKKEEGIHLSINKDNLEKYDIQLHRVNAIGHLVDD